MENHQIVLLGLRRQYEGDRQKVILANPEPDMLICPEDELYVLYPADTANTCTTPDARDVAPTDATIVANVDRDVISAISPLQQF